MFKMIIFDLDGVIFKPVNFWMELHKKMGTFEEGKKLTEKYLHSDYDKLVEEVVNKLWKGKPASAYFELVNSLDYNLGVKEFFEYIHKNNFRTAVISSSSYDVVLRAKNELGIDYIFSNALVIKDDKISGDFLWPIGAGNESKAIVMKKLCSDINIETKDVVFIGDSITDLHAVWEAGYSIAFNSKSDELKKNTSVVVDSNDARDLISVLENIKN